jgi:hypothetical protein
MWVTGLPDITNLIVVGQDYVAEGTQVDAEFEGSSSGKTENANVSGIE